MDYKVIDLTYLNEISTSFVFIKKMIDMFRSNLVDFEHEMNVAIQNKDYSKLGEIAHKAKSSVMIFGMKAQSEEMKSLEFDAKNAKNIDTYSMRVDGFIKICKEALLEINDLEKSLE